MNTGAVLLPIQGADTSECSREHKLVSVLSAYLLALGFSLHVVLVALSCTVRMCETPNWRTFYLIIQTNIGSELLIRKDG